MYLTSKWIVLYIVGALRDLLCRFVYNCEIGTGADQTIINSFFEGAKAGARWSRHIG